MFLRRPSKPAPAAPDVSSLVYQDNPKRHRFEVLSGEEVMGFSTYRATAGEITFIHTEVSRALEGQGVGSALVRFAFAHAREHGLAVIPLCPFIDGYLKRHPEDVELVPQERRAEFGLG